MLIDKVKNCSKKCLHLKISPKIYGHVADVYVLQFRNNFLNNFWFKLTKIIFSQSCPTGNDISKGKNISTHGNKQPVMGIGILKISGTR